MKLSKITKRMVQWAAQYDDLSEALKPLQDVAGIDDGGIAGQHFSGPRLAFWPVASQVERVAMIVEYIEVERIYQ